MSESVTPAQVELYNRAKDIAREALMAGLDGEDMREAIYTAAIDAAVDLCDGNKCRAARMLRIHRNTIAYRLKR